MKPLFTLFAFLLIVSQVFAQLPVEHFNKWRSPDGRNIDFLYLSNSKTTAQYPRLEVIGSPFENDKFQPAYITKQDGSKFSPLFMRYNAYYDIMELKHATSEPDSLIMILEKTPEFTIHIKDKTYLLLKEPNSNENLHYFEVLHTGNSLQLLKRTTKKFIEGKIARTSFEKDFPHRFNDQVTYYLKDKSFIKLPRSNRKKIALFEKINNDVVSYIRENNLDLDEEQSLIEVAYFLNKSHL